MFLTLIIGETGSGKSTIAKSIWNRTRYGAVYDFQNEYAAENYVGAIKPKLRVLPTTHEPDVIFALDKVVSGYTFVIEECTGLFASGKVPEACTKRILSKRHTRNNWVLIFHSIQDVPPRFFRFCDVIILFKTGDFEKDVKNKVPEYMDVFRHLQKSTVKHPSPIGGGFFINDYKIIKKSNLSKF
jgi:hypothetical protein